MTPDKLFEEFTSGFPARKFSAGLLMAFIDLYTELGIPSTGAANYQGVIDLFPRQTTTSGGKRANTLIVARPDGSTLSLRPFYNAAERFFRAENKRFDYPSCAPHATQAWADYIPWLDALSTFDAAQLTALRQRVAEYVLAELKSQAFDPGSVKIEPPLFRLLLESFEMTAQRGEPTGAAFQGIVFGFLRADNPHLQIEIDKVRTGSKRLQRVGDIDGWEGARLAISAEVKQFEIKEEDVPDLEAFANDVGRRGALGLVAALGFRDGVRGLIENIGVKPLDTDDLLRIVELWDPLKQRTAVASLIYYASHVEKNSTLTSRIEDFFKALLEDPQPPSNEAIGE
ncbi:hypothetical protein [Methyloversatilis discipulorum]|uniref:hypothetical protein n=1 Tax=Methyloversatilis discipulorum TaxID=1119528 RepID=UPI0026EB7F96|nr:hypothetical protein [Methyloversatilis discipulorum]